MSALAILCILGGGLMLSASSVSAGKRALAPPPRIEAFEPGETLTYRVSWSKAVKAGTAVLEVKGEERPDGREVLRFIVTSRTEGVVGKFYPLGDTVQSVFDPGSMQSLSYRLEAKHGKRTRQRELVFDHARRTVESRLNSDPPKIFTITGRAQDSLSAFYYLRTRTDFDVEKPIILEVFDGGKMRSIEVQTLGREKIKTPAGEFDTIKIRAAEGIFMGEGEVIVWLTDDRRKVPVLIKSRIAIGSVVFTLKDMRTGGDDHARAGMEES